MADVVARKRLAADALPIVAHRIPQAPAAVFVHGRMHRADRAAAGCAIQDRGFLRAPEAVAAVAGNRQAGEGQELGPGHALEADIEQVQAAGRIDEVAQDDAVVVEAAGAADVQHRFGADPHDRRGIVRAHVDVADPADAVGIAESRIDADQLVVDPVRRRGERRMQHPAAHALPRGVEHQAFLGPCGHALVKSSRRSSTGRVPPGPANRRRPGPARCRG